MGRSWRLVGVMRESLADDHAADAALAEVVQRGLFTPRSRKRFDLDRVMDTPDEFRIWLEDFSRADKYGEHEWLVRRLQRALALSRRPRKITVRGQMTLGVLEKR